MVIKSQDSCEQVDIRHLHNWDDVLGYWQSKVKHPVTSGIV